MEKAMIQIPPIGLNIEVENIDEILVKLERVNELTSRIVNLVPVDDYLIKVSDVAAILGTNPGTVNKLVKTGHLKAIKIGCLKVRKKELERFLEYAEESNLSLDKL